MKLSILNLQPSALKNLSSVFGCVGLLLRVAAIVFTAFSLTQHSYDYYDVFLKTALGYAVVSLIANAALLLGIGKESHWLLLPYLAVLMLEIIGTVIGLLLAIALSHFGFVHLLVPTSIFLILYLYMWITISKLFRFMETKFHYLKSVRLTQN